MLVTDYDLFGSILHTKDNGDPSSKYTCGKKEQEKKRFSKFQVKIYAQIYKNVQQEAHQLVGLGEELHWHST